MESRVAAVGEKKTKMNEVPEKHGVKTSGPVRNGVANISVIRIIRAGIDVAGIMSDFEFSPIGARTPLVARPVQI